MALSICHNHITAAKNMPNNLNRGIKYLCKTIARLGWGKFENIFFISYMILRKEVPP
jgi:hypothetical protein